ncbi:MAG: sigma-54 dependent transcriptional regulator [Lentisphaeria bacterium]
MSSNARILIAEDDASLVEILKGLLRSLEHRVRSAAEAELVAELLGKGQWDLFFCSTRLWHAALQKQDLIALCRQKQPDTPIIMLSGYAEVSLAGLALDKGAFASLQKPLKTELAMQALKAALESKSRQPLLPLPDFDSESLPVPQPNCCELIGEHPSMMQLYEQIAKAAPTEMSVLLQGESGTGKELVAKAIHEKSKRAKGPFVAINCASLPENLLESELYGHVKGAFTGALRHKDGLFLAAQGGTLFLDEIGSIPMSMQLSLLRALQEREIRPVGALQSVPVDVRIVSASNEDLQERMAKGLLRDDLYYRLNVFPLHLPALRERKSDIRLLTGYFLQGQDKSDKPWRISSPAFEALLRHDWPGNVRELENCLQRACALSEDHCLQLYALPEYLQKTEPEPESAEAPPPVEPDVQLTLRAYMRQCERHFIALVLEHFADNKEEAAKSLGISLATLYRKTQD